MVVADNLCYVDSALAFLNKADNHCNDVKSAQGDTYTIVSPVWTKGPSGRFGNVCRDCPHVPMKSEKTDYQSIGYNEGKKWLALHFPIRCRKCERNKRRWTRAKKGVIRIDQIRFLNGYRNLKMCTFTQNEWMHQDWSSSSITKELIESINNNKSKLLQRHRNWRRNNKYWISRKASGIIYPEFKIIPR